MLARLSIFLCALIAAIAGLGETSARPNILWLVTEDNAVRYVGAYGDALARTPVFDRLAREGLLFNRAYAAAPVCAPSRASIITGMYATTLGTQHMRSEVPLPGELRYFPAYLRDAGYFTTNCAKTDYNAAVLPGTWDENGADAHWKNRRKGQPFFSVFNVALSHEGRMHRRAKLVTDAASVRVPAYLPDTPEVRADIAQYYDCVANADAQVGRILGELEAAGLLENTIVFYYSDHGGVIPRSKRFLYEEGTRVPLVVRVPQKFRSLVHGGPGTRVESLVNLVDLAPTVLRLAGAQASPAMQGRDFLQAGRSPEFTYQFRDRMDERYDLSRAVTDGRWRYIRNYRTDVPAGQRLDYLWKMASMAEWSRLFEEKKLNATQSAFFEAHPAEELYDLRQDPDNVRNLAGDPSFAGELQRFREASRAHLLATRDLGFIPEAMLRRMAADASPAKISAKDYPLERAIELLDAIQLGSGNGTAQIRAALNDASPVLRYWAALFPQGENVSHLYHDPDVSVKLAAAASTLRRRESAEAWTIFAEVLAGDASAEAKLEAANFIAQLGKFPDSVRPSIEAAAKADVSSEPGVGTLCRELLRR